MAELNKRPECSCGQGIGRSCKGQRFKRSVAQAHLDIYFHDLYVRWGWFDLGSIPARAFGFNRVITMNMICTYKCALASQVSNPSVSAISTDHLSRVIMPMRCWETLSVAAYSTCKNVVAPIFNLIIIEPTTLLPIIAHCESSLEVY